MIAPDLLYVQILGRTRLKEKLVSNVGVISGFPQRNAKHHRERKLIKIRSAGVVISKYPMTKLLLASVKVKAAKAEQALRVGQCQYLKKR